ncbi:K(+)-transporting ATPase subunit F [Bailinhaonella thermotolerans]|uniref:K(+)-transporting ATPase subunit F n=1 Tax=Bailinhaonella thermotolerans TaxID=1070861 RepID=A0A3A4ANL5_9ACTN|nr:K(+)-transporting ATPase subunit F [Bailinhaonella thermotolerans]RJL30055.1 K(+)-transporting ATPase subunit F [Bailinhaonella thermotolerans]
MSAVNAAGLVVAVAVVVFMIAALVFPEWF